VEDIVIFLGKGYRGSPHSAILLKLLEWKYDYKRKQRRHEKKLSRI
jgi:hypothetical protein